MQQGREEREEREEALPDDLETVTGPVSQGEREWMNSARRIMLLEIEMCLKDHTNSLSQCKST